MALGDKLLELTDSRTAYARIKQLERINRKNNGDRYTGPPAYGSDNTSPSAPAVDANDVTATVIPAFDGGGNYRPYIQVSIGGEYAAQRSFIGYTVRVIPTIGAVFEVRGPDYPNAPSPITIHNLPTPPQTNQTWEVQVKVRTALYGDGFWSDVAPVEWGGDTEPPPVVAIPVDWLTRNIYDPVLHITSIAIKWSAITGISDLDRYVLEYSTDPTPIEPVWTRMPPILPNTTTYEFIGLIQPSQDLRFRILAQDTSGNQSGWSVTDWITAAAEPVPDPPTGINFAHDDVEGLNLYRADIQWSESVDPNVGSYDIQFWRSGETGSPIVLRDVPTGGVYTMHGFSAGTYWFQMRSVTVHGFRGPWTTAVSHNITNGVESFAISLSDNRWNGQNGQVELEIAWSGTVTAPHFRVSAVVGAYSIVWETNDHSFVLPVEPEVDFEIFVQGKDGFGNLGDPSNTLTGTTVAIPPLQSLYNGGMEVRGAATTWAPSGGPHGFTISHSGGTSNAYLELDTAEFQTGSKSLHIKNASASPEQLVVNSLPIYVREGGTYMTYAWVKGTVGAFMTLSCVFYDRLGAQISSSSTGITATASWTRSQIFSMTAPTGAVTVRVALLATFTSQEVWVDELYFARSINYGDLDSNSHIGIGTNSVENTEGWGRALDVYGYLKGKAQVRTDNVTVRTFASDSSVSGMLAGGGVGTSTNHPFSIFTNYVERIRISSGGIVGINSTTTSQQLNVGGAIGLTGDVIGHTSPFALKAENGTLGSIRLLLASLSEYIGVRVESTPLSSANDYVDIEMYTNGVGRLMRLENRAASKYLTANYEWQFGGLDAAGPHTVMSNTGLYQRNGYIRGAHRSSDGSTGATGSFTTTDGKTVTVKDGIITAIV